MDDRSQYIEALLDNDTQQSEDEAMQQPGQVQVQRPPDALSSLLGLLARIFQVFPALGLDDSLR